MRKVPRWLIYCVLRGTHYNWQFHDGLGLFAVLDEFPGLGLCPITAFAMHWTGRAFYHELPFQLSARHLDAAAALGMTEVETQEWVAATLGQGNPSLVANLQYACHLRRSGKYLDWFLDNICLMGWYLGRVFYSENFRRRG